MSSKDMKEMKKIEHLPVSTTLQNCVKKRDLFVGNLSLYTTNEKLQDYFSQFGAVENVRIMTHPATLRSRRFGFITFREESVVTKILQEADKKYSLDGKVLDVKHAFKRSDEDGGLPPVKFTKKPFIPKEVFETIVPKPGTKVFVGGLNQETTEDNIRHHFSKFGLIKKVSMVTDRATKRSKGFCFITFSDESFANLACVERYQILQEKRIEVKKALDREKSTVFPPAISAANLPLIQQQSLWTPFFQPTWSPQVVTNAARIALNRFAPYPGGLAFANNNHLLNPFQSLLSFHPYLYPQVQSVIQSAAIQYHQQQQSRPN